MRDGCIYKRAVFFCKPPCFTLELDICEPGLVVVSAVWEAGGTLVPVQTGTESEKPRVPRSRERDWSRARSRVGEPSALVVHHRGDTCDSLKALDILHAYPGQPFPQMNYVSLSTCFFSVWTLAQADMGISAQVFHF